MWRDIAWERSLQSSIGEKVPVEDCGKDHDVVVIGNVSWRWDLLREDEKREKKIWV